MGARSETVWKSGAPFTKCRTCVPHTATKVIVAVVPRRYHLRRFLPFLIGFGFPLQFGFLPPLCGVRLYGMEDWLSALLPPISRKYWASSVSLIDSNFGVVVTFRNETTRAINAKICVRGGSLGRVAVVLKVCAGNFRPAADALIATLSHFILDQSKLDIDRAFFLAASSLGACAHHLQSHCPLRDPAGIPRTRQVVPGGAGGSPVAPIWPVS